MKSRESTRTLREKIIDLLLEKRKITVSEIIRFLDLDPRMEREVLSTIEKIPKTLKRKGFQLYMIPPKCKSCGFEFSKPKASKCPRCKSQRIEEAIFVLE
ncbi:MAG: transcriptional regulator [Archaeoglobus sp.]|nr:transcriptional regulator [Archaeoglobus sp.]